PRAHADHVETAFGGDGARQIDDVHARNLGHEDLAAVHALETHENEPDRLLQSDPEARHLGVGHRQHAGGAHFLKKRNHAAAAAHDVAVAHHAEARAVAPRVAVGGDEELVGAELGGAVEIDRV